MIAHEFHHYNLAIFFSSRTLQNTSSFNIRTKEAQESEVPNMIGNEPRSRDELRRKSVKLTWNNDSRHPRNLRPL